MISTIPKTCWSSKASLVRLISEPCVRSQQAEGTEDDAPALPGRSAAPLRDRKTPVRRSQRLAESSDEDVKPIIGVKRKSGTFNASVVDSKSKTRGPGRTGNRQGPGGIQASAVGGSAAKPLVVHDEDSVRLLARFARLAASRRDSVGIYGKVRVSVVD